MTANSILPIPIPDGIYCGIWEGFYVTISIEGEVTRFKVDKALRRSEFPCVIVIKDKKAFIDSGNPLTGLIAEWKEKAEKWDTLRNKISLYYLEPDDVNYSAAKEDSGLLGIGEDAARAFGYF